MNKKLRGIICIALCLFIILTTSMATITYATNNPEEADENYVFNTGKLYQNAFSKLPQGSVKAESWLLQQMLYQKENLTSMLHKYWAIWSEDNAWRGGTNNTYDYYWEKGPCYLRGLVALAWTLDDAELKEMAMQWIDPILESGKNTGYFGPAVHGDGTTGSLDWWPHMMVLGTLRDYYESTENEGNPDERVMEVLGGYFAFQMTEIPNNPFKLWSIARGGENIEVILWYYNRVYDPQNPEDSDWLLGLAEMIAESTASKNCNRTWTDVYINTTTREHTVDSTLALRTPAILWQMTGKEEDRIALREAIRNWGIDHGRIDGLVHSDERARENYPHRGLETCAVVEGMLSYETGMSIIGEGWIGDELENVAYNTLPACFTSDFTGHIYFQAENRVMAVRGDHEQSDDRGSEAAYSVPSGYECCLPNMHMGWPKFVSSMYMATDDGGLAVIAYGPNRVTAKVADGKTAVFHQETDYPFKDTIGITYEGDTAEFPLLLRVPGWCEAPSFKVNGVTVSGTVEDGFLRVDRSWQYGDVVEIVFPREIRISNWYNNSVGIKYGALNFSLGIKEEWRELTDLSTAETSYPIAVDTIHNLEAFAASDWNYALVLNSDNINDCLSVTVADEIPLQPFLLENAPVKISVKGQKVPEWELRANTVPEPPYSPLAENQALWEDITLVPYGCTKLRITLLPWVGEEVPSDYSTSRDADSAFYYVEDGKRVVEFDNVIVREASDYTLKVFYEGTGTAVMNINSKYEKSLALDGSGEYTLTGLISLLPTCIDSLTKSVVKGFTFDAGQYNNIRFFNPEGVTITGIQVVPVSPVTEVKINSASLTEEGTVTLKTNLSRDLISFYTVEYGTASGNYTHNAKNLYDADAVISGLEPGYTYYFRISALMHGEKVYSNEVSVYIPEFIPSADTIDIGTHTSDFSSKEAANEDWTFYGEDVVSFADGKMNVAASSNIKMTTGDESWTDYAIEATLSGGTTGSNYGIIFRVSSVSASAIDKYKGYYVGIIPTSSTMKLKIGYTDGNRWWESESVTVSVANKQYIKNTDYTLKILVNGNAFRVYVDDEFVYEGQNNLFAAGSVGARTYNAPFSISAFTVRSLTETEMNEFASVSTELPEFELKDYQSIYKGVQIATNFESPTHTYKLIYGTEPGVYTDTIMNLRGLNIPTYPNLKTDKFAVQFPENGKTYYFRLVALDGTEEAKRSIEYTVTTGLVLNTTETPQATALAESISKTDSINTSGICEASLERLEWARSLAEKTVSDPYATLSVLSLARSSLDLAAEAIDMCEYSLSATSITGKAGDAPIKLEVLCAAHPGEAISNVNVTWSSDNETVATVSSDGTVSFGGVGIANIKASIGDTELVCLVSPADAEVAYQTSDGSWYAGSLSETVAAANAQNSNIVYIKLLRDFTGDNTITTTDKLFEGSYGNYTFDFNGHDMTTALQAIFATAANVKGASITFVGQDSDVISATQYDYAPLLLRGDPAELQITINGGTYVGRYGLFANGGTVTILKGTLQSSNKDNASNGTAAIYLGSQSGNQSLIILGDDSYESGDISLVAGTRGTFVYCGGRLDASAIGDDVNGMTIYNEYYTVSDGVYTYHDVTVTDQFTLPEGYAIVDELGTAVTVMKSGKAYRIAKPIDAEAYWGTDADNLFGAGTFAEALAEANSNNTVKYIALQKTVNNFDIKTNVTYVHPSSGELTIDLNGQTLYCSNSNAFLFDVDSACTVILTDSSATEDNPAGFGVVDAKTYTSGDYGIFFVRNKDAKFIINGGNYVTARRMIYSRASDFGSVTINGGAFEAGTYVAVRESGDLIINGGELYGGISAIRCSIGSTTTINGGTFTSGKDYAIQNDGGDLTINYATVVSEFGVLKCNSGTTIILKGTYKSILQNGSASEVPAFYLGTQSDNNSVLVLGNSSYQLGDISIVSDASATFAYCGGKLDVSAIGDDVNGMTIYNGYYTVSDGVYTYHDITVTDQFTLPEGYAIVDDLGSRVTVIKYGNAYNIAKSFVPEARWGADADNLFGAGTFAEALAEANSNNTVKYIALQKTVNNFDIKTNIGYIQPASGELTIDLNGQTLYCSNSNAFLFDVYSACTVILTDSSATEDNPIGDGVVDAKTYTSGDYGIFFVRNKDAKFIINAGTYRTAKRTIYSRSSDYGSVTINGGAFEAGTYVAVRESGALTINGGVFYAGLSTVNCNNTSTAIINGGTFTSEKSYAIVNNGGIVTINYATVTSGVGAIGCYGGSTTIVDGIFMPTGSQNNICNVLYLEGSASVTISGGIFKMNYSEGAAPTGGYAIASTKNSELIINGGSFTSHFDTSSPIELTSGAIIKGGSFYVHSGEASSHSNITSYVAEGYMLNKNGSVVIAKTYVAELNGTEYETLEEALSAAAAGDVINIIGEVDLSTAVAPDGAYLGVNADANQLTVIPADFVEFKGASIRYVLADGTPKGYDTADIRFSYVFNDEFGFTPESWGWNYKLGETKTGTKIGSYHDGNNMTNLVFTNISFINFEKNISSQLWFKVNVNGTEFTVCDEYRTRTVIQVVNGVADYQGSGFEDAKNYAIKLRDEYEAYLATEEG